ncbi:YSIRK signal domain/LPXTG anchor domain surface protein, partial [Staphylococcus caprae]|uniref:Ig-like domain-containing protein n=1 Tax=Staphylococcus caprae TaxID=29380 RepID=UPI001EB988B0
AQSATNETSKEESATEEKSIEANDTPKIVEESTTNKDNTTQTSESPDIKSNNAQSATNETSKEESATEEKSIEANDTPKIVEESTTNKDNTTQTIKSIDTKSNNIQSELTDKLSQTNNKEKAVENYLSSQFSKDEIKSIMNNSDIDYENATNEEISNEILKSSLIQLANEQNQSKVLATPKRMLFRSMAAPVSLRAAVDQNEIVEKSLGYMNNYTFASLLFDPDSLDNETILNNNIIPFDIHSYMSGSNSGDRYKIDLKLDPLIAEHVTKISVNPSGRRSPVEFTRLSDENGNPTSTWEVNFIRANGGLFGGAEILSQYTATNGKIELDDTVENILNQAGDLSNNKLNYQIFVRDSKHNKIVETSESSGYFITPTDNDLVQLQNNVSTENSNAFKASSGSAIYDEQAGEYGGLLIDQQIIKNGIFSYSKSANNQWSYNYQIDRDLLPYIDSVELHKYDYKGLSGFDKTYHAEDKVADLQLDSEGHGNISSDNLRKLIEFNNSLPETVGVRMVVKLNQNVNNILTRDAQYDDQGNLVRETIKQKEDFTIAGYLTDSQGLLINNTFGTSTLSIQDYDKDGLLDRYERQVSLTDPENEDTDNDGKNDGDEIVNYKTSPLVGKPQVANINSEDTIVSGLVPLKEGSLIQTAKVLDQNGQLIGSSIVNSDGSFSVMIPSSPEGIYTIAIDSPNYENDEVNTFNIVDNSKVSIPVIYPVDDNDTEIQVTGDAGATIVVKDVNNNEIGSVQIPNDSSSATIALNNSLQAGTVLVATADKNGKVSAISEEVVVKDTTAPQTPKVNDITSDDTTITGTTEPHSTVKVTFPDGSTATG